jgi:hypothetical protein
MYRKQGRDGREETNTPNKRQRNKEDGRKKETKKREKGTK